MNILCIHILVITWYIELEVVIIMSRQWHKSLNGTNFTSSTYSNFYSSILCHLAFRLIWFVPCFDLRNYSVTQIIIKSLHMTYNFWICNTTLRPNINWTVFLHIFKAHVFIWHHGGQRFYNWSGWNSPLIIFLFIFVHSRSSWQQSSYSYFLLETNIFRMMKN